MLNKTAYAKSYNPEKIKKENTNRIVWLGLISLAVVILTFWLGLSLFPYTTGLPAFTGSDANTRPIDWNLLGSITSLVTTSLIFGGLVFAFVDNIQNANQRRLENAQTAYDIYKDVFDRLMNPQEQAARRWIIQNLPTLEELGNDKQAWMKQASLRLNEIPAGRTDGRAPGLEYLKQVLNTFDFIGFVAEHYWSVENELVYWMSPSISKVWERIELFVEEEAKLRNEPDYYEAAREFGKFCVEYRHNNFPKSNIIDNAT